MKNLLTLCSFLLALSVVIVPPVRAQFIQQGSKLVGTDAVGSARQGMSVSLSADGNTAIVGGNLDNSYAGAALVYTRSGGVWTQQGSKLVGTSAVGAEQGTSVSLSADGNTAIVGGCTDNSNAGAAWVYTRSGGVWTQQGSKLVGTGAVGGAFQGYSVSLSADGNTAIVGGSYDNSHAGAAWVYTRSGGVWTQQGSKLVGTSAVGSAEQGTSVSVSADGNTAIVGGFLDNSNAGAAWVYTRSGGVWTQQGSKLVGTGAVGSARQGKSVSLSSDGNTAIVGGWYDNSNAGAAWVYTRSGGSWAQQGSKLVGTGAVGSALQGASVSLSVDGNTAIVGGHYDNSYAGAAWVYTRSGGVWTQQGSKLVGTGAVGSAEQGTSVSLSADGSTAIVGGFYDNSSVGAAWVYNIPGSPVITAISDILGDQGGQVRLKWNKSPYDNPLSFPQVASYSIFRQSSTGPARAAKALPIPESIVMDSSLLGYDYVATVPAFQLPYYRTVIPTLEDSTSGGKQSYYFRVVAQTTNLNQYYVSGVDSGYSVDNLSPIPPQNPAIIAMANGPINIHWNPDKTDPDVGHFSVYRGTTSGFPLNNSTRLKTTVDTTVTDSTTEIGQQYYYRVTTVDIHGNESQPTAELHEVALAVELASFSATTLTTGVQLEWTTISETNSQGFYVERRPKNSGAYTAVSGLIPGARTSLEEHHYQWTDTKVTDGNYNYRLKLVDLDGNYSYSNAIVVTVSGVSGVDDPKLAPTKFALRQNYPNPFNPTTIVRYQLPGGQDGISSGGQDGFLSYHVTLRVYNMLGQEVATLVNAEQSAGSYTVQWNAAGAASGIYLCQMQASALDGKATSFTAMKKVVLLR